MGIRVWGLDLEGQRDLVSVRIAPISLQMTPSPVTPAIKLLTESTNPPGSVEGLGLKGVGVGPCKVYIEGCMLEVCIIKIEA